MEAQVSNICLSIQNLQKRKGVGWGLPRLPEQGLYRGRVTNWLSQSQILKFWLFLNIFDFFGNQKSQTKYGFFQSERLSSRKALSELDIHYKSNLLVQNFATYTRINMIFTKEPHDIG